MHEHWMRRIADVEEGPRRGRRAAGPGGRPGGPGGRRGGWRRSFEGRRTTAADREQIVAWFTGRLAGGALGAETAGPPRVTADDDEVLVVVPLAPVEVAAGAEGEAARATAEAARVAGFREDTRDQRMRVAEEAQAAFGRIVSWGATCGDTTVGFTTASVPVMTRLRMADRQVLDTLIDAGVARSRSDALAWCVRLVAEHEQQWIADLRAAFEHVEQVRAQGPGAGRAEGDDPGSR